MIDPQQIEIPILIDEWLGCYKSGWKGLICDEAFAHPAKYARNLIERIYSHVIAEGWVSRGDRVVDPFGGVALGGFDAMRRGLHWTGCELEAKFHGLGNQNIALWNERFSRMPNWGTAVLLQGDSRQLSSVLDKAQLTVSSPPYAAQEITQRRNFLGGHGSTEPANRATEERENGYGQSEGQLGAMKEGDLQAALSISSPPYVAISPEKSSRSVDYAKQYETYRSQGGGASFEKFVATQELHSQGYGNSDGQLSAMKSGSFDAAITSPPYNPPMSQDHNGSRGGQRGTTPSENGAFVKYGNTPGQLEGMSMEGFTAAISSPPFESSTQVNNTPGDMTEGRARWEGGTDSAARVKQDYADYSSDNLGNQRGDTFWSASRLILEQLYQVITPGGHAVFVVKAFVRDKKIVDFPAQWAQLCEAVGFQLLHDHHALLTEHYGTQQTMSGEDKHLTVARKSFFRRLAESKGSPKIDYENVLCFERPL